MKIILVGFIIGVSLFAQSSLEVAKKSYMASEKTLLSNIEDSTRVIVGLTYTF